MNPLPIIQTVLLTVAAIQKNWSSLLVGIAIPAVCITIIELLVSQLPPNFLTALLTFALTTPFHALFAIVCHRTVILGSDSLPNPYGMFWSDRELRFVGWTIALFVLTLLLVFSIGALAAALMLSTSSSIVSLVFAVVVWLGFIYIYTRLSLLFPATAVDEQASFIRAWQLSENNGMRMIAVALITVGPIAALSIAFGHYMPAGTLTFIVAILLRFFFVLVAVCTVSITYRQLIRIEREQFGGPRDTNPAVPPGDPQGGSPVD